MLYMKGLVQKDCIKTFFFLNYTVYTPFHKNHTDILVQA
jgi:hypothetical protein